MQINLFDAVRSQLIIGLFSLLLILLSIASGIAFCCLIGIQIHSATIPVSINIYILMESKLYSFVINYLIILGCYINFVSFRGEQHVFVNVQL